MWTNSREMSPDHRVAERTRWASHDPVGLAHEPDRLRRTSHPW